MKAIIKESFSKEDLASGFTLVTPKSFSAIKSWAGVEVRGIKYYVNKAVNLGASTPKPKAEKVRPEKG